jgi:hypothetical protein
MTPPSQCFLSYAHADHDGFDRLVENLRPYMHLHKLQLWHDKGIHAGSHWDSKIEAEIAQSQVFVLLVTNAFLGSRYVLTRELPAIMRRHQTANALVVPVIYRASAWKQFFGHFIQVVPDDGKGRLRPVCEWRDRDAAMATATEAISVAITDWFGLPPPVSPFASALGKKP